MSIEVDILKRFRNFVLEVSFSVGVERLGVLGASGCGKSVVLRCIAGVMQPDSGRIVIGGRVVFDSKRRINLPPQLRRTGLLFQQYALFPTMTVRENLEIVLGRVSRAERRRRVDEMSDKFRLGQFADQKPSQLSGGQQQRAAMARIFISLPEVIMLDEPLSALDSFLRVMVEAELVEELESFGGTVLFVSHDRDEVYRICERMLVLQNGRIAALGTTADLFRNPVTLSSARLTGVKNIASAVAVGEYLADVVDWGLRLCTNVKLPAGNFYIGIRAHHICEVLSAGGVNCFEFNVERRQSEPFRIREILTIESGNNAAENNDAGINNAGINDAGINVTKNTESKKICATKIPLIRFISGSQDPIFPQQKFSTKKHLRLPPEYLMILKED
ncbi:MAG: ATP-binding cassette domain-containing protein [Planctomycetaceae bacterium]|jgi:molybdate transport system ATP-binding protein|nr:ATP-binding cassette domain-containing protein [Planctomycetaceae bacterium]